MLSATPLDTCGRRRSPATLSSFHQDRLCSPGRSEVRSRARPWHAPGQPSRWLLRGSKVGATGAPLAYRLPALA